MKHVFAGFFELHDSKDGWADTYRVVDDDGMPFSTEALRVFDGRGVRISVELDEALEADANGANDSDSPFIYRTIGMTPGSYAQERGRRQRRWR